MAFVPRSPTVSCLVSKYELHIVFVDFNFRVRNIGLNLFGGCEHIV